MSELPLQATDWFKDLWNKARCNAVCCAGYRCAGRGENGKLCSAHRGRGKSTLLTMLGHPEQPTSGS